MNRLIAIIFALTCATLHAQSVIVKGTDAGQVHQDGAGAGSVRGYIIPATYTNYSEGRFTVWNANQDVVIDTSSGITWTRDANIAGQKDWTNAVAYCSNLTHATHSDWRLPSVAEDGGSGDWESLIDTGYLNPTLTAGHPFTNVQSGGIGYWSSIAYSGLESEAWQAYLSDGAVITGAKVNTLFVWPCRGP